MGIVGFDGTFPTGSATHTASRDGRWTDPYTWDTGTVPGAGDEVWIPAGIAVVYDSTSTAALDWLRIDGKLTWAVDQSTELRCESIGVSNTGVLHIGKPGAAVQAAYTAVIVITGTGSLTADTEQLGRGIIAQASAEVRMCGGPRTHRAQVTVDPAAAATTLTFAAVPADWEDGDNLCICATRYKETAGGGPTTIESETRTVSSQTATTVTVSALTYDHSMAEEAARITELQAAGVNPFAWILNLTRNIRIETESSLRATSHQRGHVMFMGRDVDLRYVLFYELGRTDKDIPLNDLTREQLASESPPQGDVANPWSQGSRVNIRGRYPLHWHRAGSSSWRLQRPFVKGCVIDGAPGWGVTVHDGVFEVEDTIVHNAIGAGFVCEEGQEMGIFRDCHAALIKGDIDAYKGAGGRTDDKNYPNSYDLAFLGDGFWTRGRRIQFIGCWVSGAHKHGFHLFHRHSPPTFGTYLDPPDTQWMDAAKLPSHEDMLGGYWNYNANYSADVDHPFIWAFRDNGCHGVQVGFEPTKNAPSQGFHGRRTWIENFTVLNCVDAIFWQYVNRYTAKNLVVLPAPRPSDIPNANGTSRYAVSLMLNTEDMVVDLAYCPTAGEHAPEYRWQVENAGLDGNNNPRAKHYFLVDDEFHTRAAFKALASGYDSLGEYYENETQTFIYFTNSIAPTRQPEIQAFHPDDVPPAKVPFWTYDPVNTVLTITSNGGDIEYRGTLHTTFGGYELYRDRWGVHTSADIAEKNRVGLWQTAGGDYWFEWPFVLEDQWQKGLTREYSMPVILSSGRVTAIGGAGTARGTKEYQPLLDAMRARPRAVA